MWCDSTVRRFLRKNTAKSNLTGTFSLNHHIIFQSTNGALKTINSSRLTVDVEGYLHFSNVTRKDNR